MTRGRQTGVALLAVLIAAASLLFAVKSAAAEPDITISLIQHGPAPGLDGEVYVSYTVILHNVGTTATTAPLVVTIDFPLGMTLVSFDSFPAYWDCLAGVDIVCTNSADVLEAPPNLDADTFVVVARLEDGVGASVLVTAAVSTGGETNTADNSDSVTTETDVERLPACAVEIELQSEVGAGGVTTVGATTSSTSHATQTVDSNVRTIETYTTRVTATLEGLVIFDDTVNAAANSPEAEDLFDEAKAVLEAANAFAHDPEIVESTRMLVASDNTPSTVVDDVIVAVTTEVVNGPATILVGEDQGVSCFVASGLLNINTHTHTESFETIFTGGMDTFVTTTHVNVDGELAARNSPAVRPQRPNLGGALGSALFGSSQQADLLPTPAASVSPIRPPSTGDAGLR